MASLIKEPHRPRKPWRVDWTERRQRQTKRFATKREAEAFIGDIASGRGQGKARRFTVRAWVLEWLESYGPTWEPRTVTDRGDFADRWIFPFLGKMLLGEVGRTDVRAMRSWMRRKGATAYTANRVVQVLSAAMGAAVDDGLIPANPCRGLKPLPEGPRRRVEASPDEVETMRLAMHTARDRAIISLMAYAGLRPSEVYSLRAEDRLGKTLAVRSAQRAGSREEKVTKTGSVRSLPIIPALAADLDALDAREDGLVIGPLDHRHWTSTVWGRAKRVAQPREGVVPYSLRHTFASLLIAEGRNPWQVAALMGHANPQMVITTYGHLFAEAELADPKPMAEAADEARQRAPAILRAKAPASPRAPGRRSGGAGRDGRAVGRSSSAMR